MRRTAAAVERKHLRDCAGGRFLARAESTNARLEFLGECRTLANRHRAAVDL